MRKILLLLGATLVGGVLFAQPRVIGTHPAHDGRMLTMENAIVGRLSPENRYYSWVNDNEYRFMDGRSIATARIDENLETPQAPQGWTAFSVGNSLYITDTKDTVAVAVSNDREIVYGQSVSRNEFGINRGVFWAPSGRKLAFYRKDESRVTDFPLLNILTRTGELQLLKYPMNGMDSEIVSLGIYDLDKGSTVYLNVPEFTPERFLTNISWSPDDKSVYVQVLDRTQHHMKLNQYCAATGEFVRTLLTEDDERWVEPLDPVWFLKGRKDLMIYRTDLRDGYRNLYLLDTLGNIRRLTPVDADVEYIGNDGTNVFYTSAEVSPIENHLYKVSIKAPAKKALAKAKFSKPVALTPERGWHNVSMNGACTWFFDRYANLDTPGVTLLRSTDGKRTQKLFEAGDPLKDYASCAVELGTVPSADGQFDNYYRLYYPKDFDPARKYPVKGLPRVCPGQPRHLQPRRGLRARHQPPVRPGRDGGPDGGPPPPDGASVCGQGPYRGPWLELWRFHDHQPHYELPRRVQGGRCRRSGHRLEMVRDHVRRALHGHGSDESGGICEDLPDQQGEGPQG